MIVQCAMAGPAEGPRRAGRIDAVCSASMLTTRKTVLVTGATGFVGRALLVALQQRGVAVRAAVRSSVDPAPEGLDVREIGEFHGDTDWRSALDGVDTVYHLAARVHVMRETHADPWAEFQRVNVAGTAGLARAARRAGVRRIVLASTAKVLGEATSPGERLDDDSPLRPSDPYSRSKAEAERALLDVCAQGGTEAVVLRPPLMHGPGVKGNLLRLMRWIRAGRPLPFGAIDNRRSLLAVDHFASALLHAGEHPAAAGRCFLVADAPDLSTPELIRRLARAMGAPARLVAVPERVLRALARLAGRTAEIERLAGSLRLDASGFAAATGWSAPSDVDASLERTVRAFLAAPQEGVR